jgi:hypothetical protein
MTSKYHNKKVIIDNITFDSIKEGNRYKELKLLLKAREISRLRLQPIFPLYAGIAYIADFKYYDTKLKVDVVEDVKGMRTDVYKIKKKLFLDIYGESYKFIEL